MRISIFDFFYSLSEIIIGILESLNILITENAAPSIPRIAPIVISIG